jgi:hypothetical protein
LLLDVDWASLFKSFYEKIKIKVSCRDPAKTPTERLFELDKKLYLVSILVEGFDQVGGDKGESGVDDDDQGGDNDVEDDDKFDSHENMDTDKEGEKRFDVKTPEPRYGAHGGAKTVTGGIEYDTLLLRLPKCMLLQIRKESMTVRRKMGWINLMIRWSSLEC